MAATNCSDKVSDLHLAEASFYGISPHLSVLAVSYRSLNRSADVLWRQCISDNSWALWLCEPQSLLKSYNYSLPLLTLSPRANCSWFVVLACFPLQTQAVGCFQWRSGWQYWHLLLATPKSTKWYSLSTRIWSDLWNAGYWNINQERDGWLCRTVLAGRCDLSFLGTFPSL